MLGGLSVARLVNKGFAEVNGTRLYYEIVGRGHPLVLVHGFSPNTKMWDDQFEVFAKRFKVVRYDVRGFGKSALPTVGKDYSHTKDLKALLNQLGIDYAYVVGLSMGGVIALDFALEYPEVTKALILADSSIYGFRACETTHQNLPTQHSERRMERTKDTDGDDLSVRYSATLVSLAGSNAKKL
jgi:pimeloyl-ACP methyl ester carboxylesterase